ncbi:hypothetical protein ACH6CV_02190 [Bacillota bacterium Meth-B3]
MAAGVGQAISLDTEEEIGELEQMIAIAKLAEPPNLEGVMRRVQPLYPPTHTCGPPPQILMETGRGGAVIGDGNHPAAGTAQRQKHGCSCTRAALRYAIAPFLFCPILLYYLENQTEVYA